MLKPYSLVLILMWFAICRIPYAGLFGGVTAFTKAQFELVNGFSNQFYGWGGEDDDMLKRYVQHTFYLELIFMYFSILL